MWNPPRVWGAESSSCRARVWAFGAWNTEPARQQRSELSVQAVYMTRGAEILRPALFSFPRVRVRQHVGVSGCGAKCVFWGPRGGEQAKYDARETTIRSFARSSGARAALTRAGLGNVSVWSEPKVAGLNMSRRHRGATKETSAASTG